MREEGRQLSVGEGSRNEMHTFAGKEEYIDARSDYWESLSEWDAGPLWLGGYYHQRLAEIYSFLVGPNRRILELGCGEGDLLAACEPEIGVGVDLSPGLIERAREKHSALDFRVGDAHNPDVEGPFDVVILSDLVNELWDVQYVLDQVQGLTHARSRIILNFYSRLWEIPLKLAESTGLAKPTQVQNWLTIEDLKGLLQLAGFESIRDWREILYPLQTPLISPLANRVLAKLWPLHYLCLTNFIVARPEPRRPSRAQKVSVVIPVRNEAGNIEPAIERVPEMGSGTELVFVEGGSTDSTAQVLKDQVASDPVRELKLLFQPGEGKGDAVRHGFAHATGDVLMILDGDLTVPPEDLTRFYEALVSRKAELVNGVRLVYPIEGQAMRFLNLIANKAFSWMFSWLLGQPVKDTLCGTKALWKSDYEDIVQNRQYFGEFDPFGDFDLLFGAAKLNLKIVDLPIRYRRRTYGTTNIDRWRHGRLLIRMVAFAAARLKFV